MNNEIEYRGYILPRGFSVKGDRISGPDQLTGWTLALGWEGKIVLHSTQGETRSVRLA